MLIPIIILVVLFTGILFILYQLRVSGKNNVVSKESPVPTSIVLLSPNSVQLSVGESFEASWQVLDQYGNPNGNALAIVDWYVDWPEDWPKDAYPPRPILYQGNKKGKFEAARVGMIKVYATLANRLSMHPDERQAEISVTVTN